MKQKGMIKMEETPVMIEQPGKEVIWWIALIVAIPLTKIIVNCIYGY
jgi:hypothetical protein